MSRLIVEKRGAVRIGKFSNPPDGYMDDQTETALMAFLDEVEADDSVRAVILTGNEPDVFIRHFDVGILLERGQKLARRGMTFSADRPVPEALIHICCRRMEAMPVPIIAAINGSAMGGGFEIALACDFRLVSEGPYDLGLPEINLGILPGAGGTQRLPRLIGQARALEMMLLGRTISPDEAVAYGIAMECVDGDVLARALELAMKLAEKSQKAAAHIKKLVRSSFDGRIEDRMADERTLFCDLMVDPRALDEMSDMLSGKRDIRDPDLSAQKIIKNNNQDD